MTCTTCEREKTKTLIGGELVCGYCEHWRHECEANAILHFPTLAARRNQLSLIEKIRGEAERLRLQKTMMALHKRRLNNGSTS